MGRMRSGFTAFLAMLAICASAHAATLSITADKLIYAPGEVITLTVIGNSEGASAHGIWGQIEFDPAGLLDPNAITFTPQSGGPAGWLPGWLGCTDPLGHPGTCWLINYIEDDPLLGATMDPGEQTLAIVTATAGAPGLYTVDWVVEDGLYRDKLDFFGLNSAPGATFGIFNASFQVIPEPSTALLLGLGLVAFGARSRPRSRRA